MIKPYRLPIQYLLMQAINHNVITISVDITHCDTFNLHPLTMYRFDVIL